MTQYSSVTGRMSGLAAAYASPMMNTTAARSHHTMSILNLQACVCVPEASHHSSVAVHAPGWLPGKRAP